MFRAKHKRRETAGACEVQEDHQVKVDLPIDQVKAQPRARPVSLSIWPGNN